MKVVVMEGEKKAKNGTFTQIPNVFFDTCDLPESAQILYLRLYRHIAHKDDHKFVGSIRKLSTLVRLAKSTVERMIKKLEESRLINVGSEPSQDQDRTAMTITLNPQELWILNKQHYEDEDVPIWDKVMPDAKILSQIGTVCPETGQDSLNLGQIVPGVSSKEDPILLSTSNNLNTENTEVDPSLNQKANAKPFIRMFMRKFISEIGDGDMMDAHLDYLQEVYYVSGLDKESFRFYAETAIREARQAKGDMNYFYDYICSALHLEQAN